MSGFPALINFRGSAAYVTDGAGETYCRSELDVGDDYTEAYDVNRGGLDFGATVVSGMRSLNENATVDRRFAGCLFNQNSTKRTFRLDLKSDGTWLAAGNFTVRLALGLYGYVCTNTLDCIDGASSGSLFTISAVTTGGTNQYIDATGVNRASPAIWVSSNAARTVTVTGATPYLLFVLGDGVAGNTGCLAHLEVAQVESAPPVICFTCFR